VKDSVPIDAQEITIRLLQQQCGNGTYERGNGYFQQGRVTLQQASHLGSQRIHLRATTRGSGHHAYQQKIDITRFRQGIEIDGVCSCPVGFNCKHVVAACLSYKQAEGTRAVDSLDLEAFTGWLAQIATGPQSGAEQRETGQDEFLIYSLRPGLYGNNIEVFFKIVRQRRDGTFGKGRSSSLSAFNNHPSTPRYMQPEDLEIIALLNAVERSSWVAPRLHGAAGSPALMMMVDSGRAFWDEQWQQPLRRGPERSTALQWLEEKGAYRLQLRVEEECLIVPVTPPLYLDPTHHLVGPLVPPAGIDSRKMAALASAPPIPRKEADRVSRLLALDFPALPTPTPVTITEIQGVAPTPRLTLHQAGSDPLNASADLSFLYNGYAIDPSPGEAVQTRDQAGRLVRIHRDPAAEAAAVARLLEEGLAHAEARPLHFTPAEVEAGRQGRLAAWFRFVEERLPQLQAEGWQIEQAAGAALKLSRAAGVMAEVDSPENDWFELRFDIEVEGKKIALLPLISELIGDYRPGELPPTLYLPYEEGHYIEIASALLEPILQNIIDLYDTLGAGSELRLSRLDAPRLLELGATRINGGAELTRMARRLSNFSGIKAVKLPATFKGELRDYQQQGVNWLQFLREYALAGVLADDMGLGKTVQTLAHLAVEKRAGRMKHPSLIVAPTSLMGNWRREAEQFTPGLKVLVLHGPARHTHFNRLQQYDLILTTYPLLARDGEVLQALDYHYLILDEAQVIKNHRSQAAQLVRAIRASHRLSLTGTPMENHLGELWAQFDFLLPGFLGTQEQFVRHYRTPIERHGDSEKLQRLTRRITPFMLRRSKEMVATELPAKSEFIRTIPIEGKQATLYESIRLTMEKKVREAISKQGLARSHITILDALLKLRQVCCDPRLLPVQPGGKAVPSAKFEMLMEMLPELLDEGRRILIFSQFTRMLGLIEEGLKEAGIAYTKLTGQTRKRDAAIESFRRGEVNLFLISLKAGGVGLNLTEADTVIHYDPWWNPAVESQATDRAHRIGQEKPVFVYKLLTEGTVEEKILALQERKRRLADSVYSKGQKESGLQLDAATISALLSANPDS
jgi:superfamily II DNA or RNA helicase